jgi:hypothetical protein
MPKQVDYRRDTYDFDPPRAQVTGLDPNPPQNIPTGPTHLHRTTFEYLRPTDEQVKVMSLLRTAARQYSDMLEEFLPDGPDKTFILRAHRANAMWANVAVTRLADGTPRT